MRNSTMESIAQLEGKLRDTLSLLRLEEKTSEKKKSLEIQARYYTYLIQIMNGTFRIDTGNIKAFWKIFKAVMEEDSKAIQSHQGVTLSDRNHLEQMVRNNKESTLKVLVLAILSGINKQNASLELQPAYWLNQLDRNKLSPEESEQLEKYTDMLTLEDIERPVCIKEGHEAQCRVYYFDVLTMLKNMIINTLELIMEQEEIMEQEDLLSGKTFEELFSMILNGFTIITSSAVLLYKECVNLGKVLSNPYTRHTIDPDSFIILDSEDYLKDLKQIVAAQQHPSEDAALSDESTREFRPSP